MKTIGIFLLKRFSVWRRLWYGLLGFVATGLAVHFVLLGWVPVAGYIVSPGTPWWLEILVVFPSILLAIYGAGTGIELFRRTRPGKKMFDHLPTTTLEKPRVEVDTPIGRIQGVLLGTVTERYRQYGKIEYGAPETRLEVWFPTASIFNPGATLFIASIAPELIYFPESGGNGSEIIQRYIKNGARTDDAAEENGTTRAREWVAHHK